MPKHYSLYLRICVFHPPNPPRFFLALKKFEVFYFIFFITIILIIIINIILSLLL